MAAAAEADDLFPFELLAGICLISKAVQIERERERKQLVNC